MKMLPVIFKILSKVAVRVIVTTLKKEAAELVIAHVVEEGVTAISKRKGADMDTPETVALASVLHKVKLGAARDRRDNPRPGMDDRDVIP